MRIVIFENFIEIIFANSLHAHIAHEYTMGMAVYLTRTVSVVSAAVSKAMPTLKVSLWRNFRAEFSSLAQGCCPLMLSPQILHSSQGLWVCA